MNEKLKFLFDHDILLNADRVGPYSVEIDPTNYCPINCSYCVWSKMRKHDLVSLREDIFRNLIDDLIGIRASGIVFTGGGEPLNHPFTREAIERAKVGGISVGLYTSGVPLNNKICLDILPHLSWIRFNLSAADQESYKQIHGVDIFKRVVENITNCVTLRNQWKLNVNLGIGCVLSRTKTDLRMISLLMDMSEKLSLDFIQFKHDLNEIGTIVYENWWNAKVLPELQSLTQTRKSGIKIEFSDHTYTFPSLVPCFTARKMATIKADGTVYLCKLHRNTPSMAIGNIYNKPFREIWKNSRRQEIITMLEQEGCSTFCAYKDFNKYVLTTLRAKGRGNENRVIPSITGIQQFGEEINFL